MCEVYSRRHQQLTCSRVRSYTLELMIEYIYCCQWTFQVSKTMTPMYISIYLYLYLHLHLSFSLHLSLCLCLCLSLSLSLSLYIYHMHSVFEYKVCFYLWSSIFINCPSNNILVMTMCRQLSRPWLDVKPKFLFHYNWVSVVQLLSPFVLIFWQSQNQRPTMHTLTQFDGVGIRFKL